MDAAACTVGGTVDAFVQNMDMSTRYMTGATVSADAASPPELRGLGHNADVRMAMSEDAALLVQVAAIDKPATNDNTQAKTTEEAA